MDVDRVAACVGQPADIQLIGAGKGAIAISRGWFKAINVVVAIAV